MWVYVYNKGFGLLEIMVALVVVGILLAIGLPSIVDYQEQTRADVRIMQLYHTLIFARQTAISANQAVIICPTSNQQACGGNWSGELMVFIDQNHNQRRDNNEQILRLLQPNTAGKLRWSGFGAASYLIFLPYGFTNQQNGTFIYCSPSHQISQTRGIIINKSGRARLAKVTNQGGIINANGEEVHC